MEACSESASGNREGGGRVRASTALQGRTRPNLAQLRQYLIQLFMHFVCNSSDFGLRRGASARARAWRRNKRLDRTARPVAQSDNGGRIMGPRVINQRLQPPQATPDRRTDPYSEHGGDNRAACAQTSEHAVTNHTAENYKTERHYLGDKLANYKTPLPVCIGAAVRLCANEAARRMPKDAAAFRAHQHSGDGTHTDAGTRALERIACMLPAEAETRQTNPTSDHVVATLCAFRNYRIGNFKCSDIVYDAPDVCQLRQRRDHVGQ
ncbi:unnamed protein product, partial [Iphiclides podalirius]